MLKENETDTLVKYAKTLKLYTYYKNYEETAGGDTLYFAKVFVPVHWMIDYDLLEHIEYRLYLVQYSDQTREKQISITDTGYIHWLMEEEPPGYVRGPDLPNLPPTPVQYFFPESCYIEEPDVILL